MTYPNHLISVIIPTHNRSKFLILAVESILQQTYPNIEIIIIDDYSSDNTQDLIKGKYANNPKIAYYRNAHNMGACKSRNFGFSKANGEYICFLDDDDTWFKEKLELQIAYFNQTRKNIGAVSCGCIRKGKNISKEISYSMQKIELETLLSYNPICDPLISTEILQEIGLFDPNLKSSQDWDLWIRIAEKYEIINIPKPLMFHRIHGEQISLNYNKIISGQSRILTKYKKYYDLKPILYLKILNTLSFSYFKMGNYRQYLKFIIYSLKIKKTQLELLFLIWLPIITLIKPVLKSKFIGNLLAIISKRDLLTFLD